LKKISLNFILKFTTLFLILTKNTITLLRNHRNTQQWQVRLEPVLFAVRISNGPLFPFNSCYFCYRKPN